MRLPVVLLQEELPPAAPAPEAVPWGGIVVVLLVGAFALLALWWRRPAQTTTATPVVDAPPGTVPMEDDPPSVWGRPLPTGGKIVVLVAGHEVAERALVPDGAGGFDLLPKAHWPAGFVPQAGLHFRPADNMRKAWTSCVRRYGGPTFAANGWTLVAVQARGAAQVQRTLRWVARAKPAALAVHYVGHGDLGPQGPRLTFVGLEDFTVRVPGPNGPVDVRAQRPNDVRRTDDPYLTAQLADDVKAWFSAAALGLPAEIPKTLVVDGCGNATALDNADAARQLQVGVSVDVRGQDCILGLFSERFGRVVTPPSYNALGAAFATEVTSLNPVSGTTVTAIDGTDAKLVQNASATTWRSPP